MQNVKPLTNTENLNSIEEIRKELDSFLLSSDRALSDAEVIKKALYTENKIKSQAM
jgi:hypothetical protein